MMEALIPILIGIAAKVGAPLVESVLTKHVGPLAGSVAGDVIDSIVEKAGGSTDPGKLETAVKATESEAPEIMVQWVASQKLSNDLQLAEMSKEGTWTWAWRPAWMWFLGFLWLWMIVLVPLANAAFKAGLVTVDAGTLFSLTGAYLALYMGGHTAKEIWGSRK